MEMEKKRSVAGNGSDDDGGPSSAEMKRRKIETQDDEVRSECDGSTGDFVVAPEIAVVPEIAVAVIEPAVPAVKRAIRGRKDNDDQFGMKETTNKNLVFQLVLFWDADERVFIVHGLWPTYLLFFAHDGSVKRFMELEEPTKEDKSNRPFQKIAKEDPLLSKLKDIWPSGKKDINKRWREEWLGHGLRVIKMDSHKYLSITVELAEMVMPRLDKAIRKISAESDTTTLKKILGAFEEQLDKCKVHVWLGKEGGHGKWGMKEVQIVIDAKTRELYDHPNRLGAPRAYDGKEDPAVDLTVRAYKK